MAKEIGRYDPDIQMFVEKPRDASMNHLRLLRFQAERGDFGPKPLSAPKGDNIFRMTPVEIRRYAMIQGDQELKPTESQGGVNDHIAKTGDY